jgi:hypothetical protein
VITYYTGRLVSLTAGPDKVICKITSLIETYIVTMVPVIKIPSPTSGALNS